MSRRPPNSISLDVLDPCEERELSELLHQVSRSCAGELLHKNATLSFELYTRIDDDGQSLSEAAIALGIGVRDCSYLLDGFSRDLSRALVRALGTRVGSD